jgi:hypothetical protein
MNPIDISDYIKCGMCNLGIGNSIRLQCEHVICEPCLEAMINYKFSDNLTVVTLDKKAMFKLPDVDQPAFQYMTFGTEETDGIIECTECQVKYSVLSPIYRDSGIPKRIESIVTFKTDDKLVTYHICTPIDAVHLLNGKQQKMILERFDYNIERDLMTHLLSNEQPEILALQRLKEVYHGIIINEQAFIIIDTEECPVCDSTVEHKYSCKHATINDFCNFLQATTRESTCEST